MIEARARSQDPATSHAAAESMRMTDLEAKVLEALHAFPFGATTHELADAMQASLVSVSPRMHPLAAKGLVVDSGQRRRNPSGRSGIVWRIVR
jgi:hypothetical protein